jgi:hypothetical protein
MKDIEPVDQPEAAMMKVSIELVEAINSIILKK